MIRKTINRLSYLGYSFLLVGILLTSLTSCSSNVYDQTIEIGETTWAQDDSVAFAFEIADTNKLYNIFLTVGHLTSYSYQNLYCMIESYGPSGLVQKQLSSLDLASKKGRWKGDCTKEACLHNIPFIVRTKFDVAGQYKIVLKQYSRAKQLEGIKSMRLQIREAETTN